MGQTALRALNVGDSQKGPEVLAEPTASERMHRRHLGWLSRK
jgi:hypothetical protein